MEKELYCPRCGTPLNADGVCVVIDCGVDFSKLRDEPVEIPDEYLQLLDLFRRGAPLTKKLRK